MDHLVPIINHYRYWALLPLAMVEGRPVGLTVGFLLSTGRLDFWPAIRLLLLADLIPDTFYYYLGRWGNHARIFDRFVSKLPTATRYAGAVEHLWKHHPAKTMFFSKLAWGLSTPFMISAGWVKFPYRKFILLVTPTIIFQYLMLISLGYYLGDSYQKAGLYVRDASIFLALAIVLIGLGYAYLSRRLKTKLEQIDK